MARKKGIEETNNEECGESSLPCEVEMLIEIVKEMMLKKNAHLEEANRLFFQKLIILILKKTRGDKRRTARLLGIDSETLSNYRG